MIGGVKLFILADSISIHYGPYLAQFLGPDWSVQRKGEPEGFGAEDEANPAINGGDSSQALEYLQSLLQRGLRADLLLLNCGLHDIRRTPQAVGGDSADGRLTPTLQDGRLMPSQDFSSIRTTPGQYRANLIRILAEAVRFAPRLVWVRTTPVYDDLHNARMAEFKRFNPDVVAYNTIADAVMDAAGTPRIDLYTFTLGLGRAVVADHVHYTPEARRLQAAFIAGKLSPGTGD